MIQTYSSLSTAEIDKILQFHHQFVAEPYGLGEAFSEQIRTSLTLCLSTPSDNKFWLATDSEEVVGTIGIVKADENIARVRWLLAHPDYRDALEKELLEQALEFCQGKYAKVYLLAATLFGRLAPLARKVGFQKTEERTVVLWGQTLTDERYELELSKAIA
jgi:hypothetical protein